MANALAKNAYFVDTVGSLNMDALKPVLYGVLVTPSAANSRVVIKDESGGTVVVDIKIEAVESRYLNLEPMGGLELKKNFEITTLTNITSVILYGNFGAPVGKAR